MEFCGFYGGFLYIISGQKRIFNQKKAKALVFFWQFASPFGKNSEYTSRGKKGR